MANRTKIILVVVVVALVVVYYRFVWTPASRKLAYRVEENGGCRRQP